MSTTSPEEVDRTPGMDEQQPKKIPTLKEVNKTLTFDYMFEHEPFDDLPRQYYPQKKYNHRPPIFDWGITITTKELQEFGNKYGLRTAKPSALLSSSECSGLLGRTTRMFNERHGLDVRTWIDISFPVSKEPVVLLKVLTNYGTILSPDAVLDLCEDVESSFGKRGKWYISDANESLWND
ncbi:hypothetical protein L218DRAFT_1080540 [Marasmius fiardii PR-910]|nr:hypothetical protein L218DRAFT_1080540 [Marasmius fiardii PR-910]